MSSDVLRVVPFLQRPNFNVLMSGIEQEPDFEQLKETALKCYERRFFTKKNNAPLVIIAMHLDSPILVKKFREIDQESRDYPLNELIMHVALKNITSSEIRDYLFSKASKAELSKLLCYSENAGRTALQNTILHVAIENDDEDLIERLLAKKVDLNIKGERGKTALELASLNGKLLKVG